MLLMTCSICGRQYDSHAVTSHACPKLYTEAELQEKQVELLREIVYKIDSLSEYNLCEGTAVLKDEVIAVIKSAGKINKLEGK